MKGIQYSTDDLKEPLTKEELNFHFKKYYLGSLESREIIIQHNIKLVLNQIYKRFNNLDYEFEELRSIGTIGLIKAVDTFNDKYNYEFSTYAVKCINNEIINFIKKKDYVVLSLDEEIGNSKNDAPDAMTYAELIANNSPSHIELIEKREIIKGMLKCLENLDEKSIKIIKLYFGFYNNTQYNQKEISKIIGINESEVSKKIKKSLIIIKNNLINEGLIDGKIEMMPKRKRNNKGTNPNKHKLMLTNKILQVKQENISNEVIEQFKIYIEDIASDRDKLILKLFYGIDSDKEYNYEELIPLFKISEALLGKIIQRNTDGFKLYLKSLESFEKIEAKNNDKTLIKKKHYTFLY